MVSIRKAIKAAGTHTIEVEIAGMRVASTPGSRRALEIEADARDEVGYTALSQLRWLVAQVNGKDVRSMTNGERVTFDYGLRALVLVPGLTWSNPRRPLRLSVLARLQREIRRGLRELLAPVDQDALRFGSYGWRLPPLVHRLQRNQAGSSPQWWMTYETANLRTAILHGIAAVIQAEGHRLRRCPKCGVIFVKSGRRVYCTSDPGCSQKARVARRR